MASLAQVIPIDAKQSLFEIRDYIECLHESIEGLEDPQLRAQAEAELDAFLVLEVKKVDRITSYLAHIEGQQQLASDEIKRLQERKRSLERAQERVEASVERVMTTWGMQKLHGHTSTLLLKKCPPSVEVVDQAQVPAEYIRVVVTESVDKTSAKNVLKDGTQIPGLKLVTDKQSVVRR